MAPSQELSLRWYLSMVAVGLGSAALIGCTEPTAPVGTSAQAVEIELAEPVVACPTVPTDIHKSLVVTEPETLALFGFGRVMDHVLASVKHDPAQTRSSLFQAWMSTYAPSPCPGAGIDPHGYGLLCPRTREASLAASDPFNPAGPDFFHPVGLFNRFDLAPSDGRNCGEYRIVFAKQSTSALDRGFLIFEASLPNPTPEQGLAGCFPVVSFWQSLSEVGPAKRAEALERFYFDGIKGFEPAIAATHYGLVARRGGLRLFGYGDSERSGQVRTNMFPDATGLTQWNLREFKLDLDCTLSPSTEDDDDAAEVKRPLPNNCRLRFEHVADANNPADELFDNTNGNAPDFQDAFTSKDLESLARNGGTPACGGGANVFGMAIADDHNEFESIASGVVIFDVEYDNFAVTPFRTAVQTKLTAIGSSLTPKNIFDRAQTQTCAGCHNRSNNDDVGGGVIWPESLGFTQIDENSALSDTLLDAFLPFRKCVLDDFIDRICNGYALDPVDGDRTVSGQNVGAAN